MPYLKITTSCSDLKNKSDIMQSCVAFVSDLLDKSEQFVMVELNDGAQMMFGSIKQDVAYLQLKSIGLPVEKTTELSKKLTAFMSDLLGINSASIYIEFSDIQRNKWGWNGRTFEK